MATAAAGAAVVGAGAAGGVLLEKWATVSRCSVCTETETETGWVDSKKGCEVHAYICTEPVCVQLVRTFVVCRLHYLPSSGDRCLLSHRLPHPFIAPKR